MRRPLSRWCVQYEDNNIQVQHTHRELGISYCLMSKRLDFRLITLEGRNDALIKILAGKLNEIRPKGIVLNNVEKKKQRMI